MRGKVPGLLLQHLTHGITPAYAGKSIQQLSLVNVAWDHPRVCGEKPSQSRSRSTALGSPPRMRGKEKGNQDGVTQKGITPAYAGKRRALRAAFRLWCWITPAYAGKRLKRSRSTVPPVAIVPLFPSVCNKPVVSDGSPAGRDAPLFLPAENAVPASPAYNLRSL